ncbi:MAG: GLPGLI family protein [Duncaniella sp.]|nr:GLPGLI family protein [Duncaniella sp.]
MKDVVRFIISFVFISLTTLAVSAQERAYTDEKRENTTKKSKKSSYSEIDTTIYKITYNCKIVTDTAISDYKKDGLVATLVGDKYTEFIDKAYLDSDELDQQLKQEGLSIDDRRQKTAMVRLKKLFKERILINYPRKDVNFFHCYLSGNFKQYEDSTAIQQWTISDETKDYLGHTCRKATCRFRGRDYVAWYAEDIPIPYGPFIFRGLPGLIIELHDTNNEYAFNMVGLEKPEEPMPIKVYVGKVAERLTREDFRFLKEYYNDNGAASLWDGAIKLQVSPERKAELEKRLNRPKPYNPIELE